MTDVQIIKQANEYAEQHKMRTDFGCWWEETYDTSQQVEAYIAGAHSRDEEIEELKKRIAELEDEVAQLANGENY